MSTTSQRTDSQERADYLREVCGLLWPPPAEVTSGQRDNAEAGHRSAGNHRELIVLPGLARPRLLVPSGRRASAAAVRGYGEPGSARAKLATKVLATALA